MTGIELPAGWIRPGEEKRCAVGDDTAYVAHRLSVQGKPPITTEIVHYGGLGNMIPFCIQDNRQVLHEDLSRTRDRYL